MVRGCGCGLRRQPYDLGIEDNFEVAPLAPVWKQADQQKNLPYLQQRQGNWCRSLIANKLNLTAGVAVLALLLLVSALAPQLHAQGFLNFWPFGDGIYFRELVLEDRFDGEDLDRTLWSVESNCWGGGNQERQCYRDDPANLFVQEGKLHLRAIRGDFTGSLLGCSTNVEDSCTWTQPFTSARVRTLESPRGTFRYGRFEVRARLPKGDYLWPAIWLLPADNKYGSWAASGEIDIMEFRSQQPDVLSHALHFWATWPYDKTVSQLHKVSGISDFHSGFHDFVLEWVADPTTRRPKEMRWLVDGVKYYSVDLQNDVFFPPGSGNPLGSPWDQKFYIILNVAVGGSFFGGAGYPLLSKDAAECDAVASTWMDPQLEVEHVRVWAQQGFEDFS